MHNNEFERQVQRQMEEFRLPPSDEVWQQVQAGIRKEKRRRIWRFAPAALLLLVPGYLWMVQYNKSSKPAVAANTTIGQPGQQASAAQKTSSTTINADGIKLYTDSANNINKETAAVKPVIADKNNAGGDENGVVKNNSAKTSENKLNKQVNATAATTSNNTALHNAAKTRKVNHPTSNAGLLAATSFGNSKGTGAKGSGHNMNASAKPGNNKPNKNGNVGSNNSTADFDSGNDMIAGHATIDNNTVLVKPNAAAQIDENLRHAVVSNLQFNNYLGEIKAPAIKIEKPAVQKAKKMSKWEWGVQATPGLSNVTKAYTRTPNVQYYSLASGPYNNNSRGNSYAIPNPQPNNGLAFSVGLYAKKAIKKLYVDIGLNYSYFSSSVRVGQKVDSTAIVRLQDMSLVSANAFYPDGDKKTYHNQYHFIEIPVSVGMDIFKIGDAKVSANVGASYAYMVSGKMLFHNSYGSHFENESLINRSQVFLHAGIGVLVNEHAKLPLTVGPVVSYGVQRLANPSATTGQHIISMGLKASMALQKIK